MAAQNLAIKVAVTPVLIGGSTLSGRRFGHHVGGWLVGLPYTSGPVAFFLATDQGERFAAATAVGMLAATASQVAFALAYGQVAPAGSARALSPEAPPSPLPRPSSLGCTGPHWPPSRWSSRCSGSVARLVSDASMD